MVRIAQGSATTAFHVFPASTVMKTSPPVVVAKPVVSDVKRRSLGSTSDPALVARVLGTAVRRDHVRPASVERRTLPLPSSSTPTRGDGKSSERMPPEQRSSLAVHGRRRKLRPPSSERRSAHDPPTTRVCGPRRRIVLSGSVSPVARPLQVRPPSVVLSSVPNAPEAYPVRPANSTASRVSPCGRGSPQNHPEWLVRTAAGAGIAIASAQIAPQNTALIRPPIRLR